MGPSGRIRRGLLIAALVLGGASGAAAQTTSSDSSSANKNIAQLNEEGTQLYQQRDYRRAIERFIQAYAMDPDPNLLFNIARSYERLGELDAAIEKYEAFLKAPGADTGGRSRAEESLRALREAKARASEGRAQPLDAEESAAPPSARPASAAPGERDGDQSSVVPWLALGGGIAFTTLGVSLYLLGAGDHDKVTDARGYGDPNQVVPLTRKEAEDLVSSGDTKKLLGGIGMGVGGALLASYVVLLVTRDSPSDQALAFGAAPARGGGSVSLTGRF